MITALIGSQITLHKQIPPSFSKVINTAQRYQKRISMEKF